MTSTLQRPQSPFAHLGEQEREKLGKELDAIHDEVFADLGDRDRAYIKKVISVQRQIIVAGRVLLLGSRSKTAWVLGTACLGMAKILENMEIGHNVMHGQWDWMNDPDIHSSVWDWDTASTRGVMEALAQLHPPHLHKHSGQGQRSRLRDHAHRSPPAMEARLPGAILLQRSAHGAVRVGRGGPRHGYRSYSSRREAVVGGAQGPQRHRRQGALTDPEGLHRLAGDQRGRICSGPIGIGWQARAAGEVATRPAASQDLEQAARRRHGGFAGQSCARGGKHLSAHVDRQRRRERHPQCVGARHHLLRPLSRPDLHIQPGRGRGRDARRSGTCASWSARPTSTAAHCSTSSVATSVTKWSTTCIPTCRPAGTPRSRPRSRTSASATSCPTTPGASPSSGSWCTAPSFDWHSPAENRGRSPGPTAAETRRHRATSASEASRFRNRVPAEHPAAGPEHESRGVEVQPPPRGAD